MSRRVRLERTATYVVWQEISVSDDFDLVNRDDVMDNFSEMPYPDDRHPDPRNGKAEITQWMVWESGRMLFFNSSTE